MAGWVVKWEEKKYDSGGMYGVHGHDTFFAVAPAAADQNDGLLPSELPGKLDTCSNMQQLRWLGRFRLDFDKGIDYCSIPFI